MKFDLNDITIEPAILSNIESRKQCDPYDANGFLPLISAPMLDVANYSNVDVINENKIYCALPRQKKYKQIVSYDFSKIISFSLSDFEHFYLKEEIPLTKTAYVLIDTANAHSKKVYDTCKFAKEIYANKLYLMVGNVAHPKTYVEYSNIGVDGIRIGIGGGSGCLTSTNTAIHYPLGSLIHECFIESLAIETPALIIADGGFRTYSDIIKAYALGADMVMIGGIINKAIESTGQSYFKGFKVSQSIAEFLYNNGYNIKKNYRGMSSKSVQRELGNEIIKTSEGLEGKRNKVEYTLSSWVENFEDYLRSAMSYCNATYLHDFIGIKVNQISQNAFNRFDK